MCVGLQNNICMIWSEKTLCDQKMKSLTKDREKKYDDENDKFNNR